MTVVLCSAEIASLVIQEHSAKQLGSISDTSILETDSSVTEVVHFLQREDVPYIDVLLDRFIIACKHPDKCRQQACDALFNLISETYEQEISSSLNKDTIHVMTEYLEAHNPSKRNGQLLDFGCGPGLSLSARCLPNTVIVGYERVQAVRVRALTAGLLQLHPNDVCAMPCTFTGGFASFVLHLCPDFSELVLLLSLVLPGGCFVANFHKGKGLEQAVLALKDSGWAVLSEVLDTPAAAGPSRVFKKVSTI